MPKITPFLWFEDNAEEAVRFYTSIFRNSKVTKTTRYDEEGAEASGRPKGTVMTVAFRLDGNDFVALNGGPIFKFTEAISFVVDCESQDEIDYYWSKLSAIPAAEQCGWLKDRYGVSWQIVPSIMNEMFKDDEKVRHRGFEAGVSVVIPSARITYLARPMSYDERASGESTDL